MALTNDKLTITLEVDSKGAVSGIEGAKKALEQVGLSAEKTESSFSKTGASVVALNQAFELASKAYNAVIGTLGTLTAAYFEAEQIQGQLAFTLSMTSANAEKSMATFEALATELAKTTLADDDLIKSMANQAKMIGLSDVATEKLIRASVDLGATNGDIKGSFKDLLNTYKGNIRAVALLDGDIKGLSDTQLAAGGAVDLVAKKVKGQGEALAATAGGSVKQAQKSFGELQETLGEFVSALFNVPSGANATASALGQIEGIVKSVVPYAKALGQTLVSIDWASVAIGVGLVSAAMGLYIAGTWLAVTANNALALAVLRTASAQALLLAQYTLIAAGIAAAFGAIEILIRNFDKLDVVGSLVIESLYNGFLRTAGAINWLAKKFFELIGSTQNAEQANIDYNKTQMKIEESNKKLAASAKQIDLGVTGKIIGTISTAVGGFSTNLDVAKNSTEKLKSALADAKPPKILDEAAMKSAISNLDALVNKAKELKVTQDNKDLGPVAVAEVQLKTQMAQIDVVKKELQASGQLTATRKEQLAVVAATYQKQVEIVKVTEERKRLEKQGTALLKENETAYKSILDANKALQDQQDAIGKTQRDLLNERIKKEQEVIEKQKEALKFQLEAAKKAGDFGGFAKAQSGINAVEGAQTGLDKRAAKGESDIQKTEVVFGQGGSDFLNGMSSTMTDMLGGLTAAFSPLTGAISAAQALVDFIPNMLASIDKLLVSITEFPIKVLQGITKIFDSILNLIIQLPENLVRMVEGLLIRIPQFLFQELPKVLMNLVKELPSMIQRIIDGVIKAIPEIIKGLYVAIPRLAVGLVAGIVKNTPKITMALVKAIPDVAIALAEAFVDVVKSLFDGSLFDGMLDGAFDPEAIIGGAEDIMKSIANATSQTFSVQDLAEEAAAVGKDSSIGQAILDATKKSVSWLSKAWEAIKAAFQWIYDTFLKPFVELAKAAFGFIWETAKAIFGFIWESAKVIFTALWEIAKGVFTFIVDMFKIAFNVIIALFKNLWEVAKGVFRAIVNLFMAVWEAAKTILMVPINMLKALWEFVTTVFDNPIAAFKTLFENVKGIFQGVVDKFNGVFNAVGNVFTPIIDGFKNAFNIFAEAGAKIWASLSQLGSVISGALTSAWEGLKTAFNTLTSGITSAFSNVWEGLKTAFKAVINPFIDLFNALKIPSAGFDLPKVLGGGSVALWSEFDLIPGNITKLAKGGIVEFANGGMASGTDTVPAMLTPGEFIMSKPAVNQIGIDNLKTMNRGQSNSGGTQNITINLDITNSGSMDESFVRNRIMPAIKDELKRASLDGQYILSARGVR